MKTNHDVVGESYFPVVVFDLDGTLIRSTSASQFLAQQMDKTEEMEELERQFRSGEISNSVIADASAKWFTDVAIDDVWSSLANAPWIDGLDETIAELRASSSRLVLATVTWRFAAEMLLQRGFDDVCGTEMDASNGTLSGRVGRYFDEHDKARFIEQWCAERSIPLKDVAAVGDSRSDVPLFGRVGRAIALNATADARSAANVSIDTDDLRGVLPHLKRSTRV